MKPSSRLFSARFALSDTQPFQGTTMKLIGKWIKSAAQQILDPDKEQRIQEVAEQLYQELKTLGDTFSIASFVERSPYTLRDIEFAKQKIFNTYLANVWKDGKVDAKESNTIAWLQRKLGVSADEGRRLHREAARDRFSLALANAIDDGEISEVEAIQLEDIACGVGMTLGDFVRAYFQTEGESFLRGVFAACIEGGALSKPAWETLALTTQRLGLSRNDLLVAIRSQTERFVEHVLADAKSDGILTGQEDKLLKELVVLFELPTAVRKYIDDSLVDLRNLRLISEGKLPILGTPLGVTISAGEIVHFHSPAVWMQKRILKSGEIWDQHNGTLTITDNRLLFSSVTKSFGIRFGRIVSHAGSTGRIHLQRSEKPEALIRLKEDKPIAYAILDAAIAFANQTRTAKQDAGTTRFIAREVRQRVWQRYGGRCADCGENRYLEFDHIVPVAKGGSNSDANVQLLCRNCNLKKSDRI
jgi:tellurite resistance protein